MGSIIIVMTIGGVIGFVVGFAAFGRRATVINDRARLDEFQEFEKGLYPFLRACDGEATVISPIVKK
jgi:hypothetical protein